MARRGGYVPQKRFSFYAVSAYRRRALALTSLRYSFAQRPIPLYGAMGVVPSCAREYSTATAFDFVKRFAINHADSRLRRVLVSARREMLRGDDATTRDDRAAASAR